MFGSLLAQSSTHESETSRRQLCRRNDIGSSNQEMLRHGVHTSKGFGRIVKAALQSPMELSLGITKGFHNVPKLWGDDTVRRQERVSDFRSGVKAVGKEFGFGWYDGVTGLVTQPWYGAQKEGASGFLKGIGKGIGGFLTKPGAALFGIPAYMMKGVHKEVQKLYGSNAQSYIITSRAAQGYEEWLQSSDEAKQEVMVRWKLIQKYLKKKCSPDEMLRDVLEAQQKKTSGNREAGRPSSSSRPSGGTGTSIQDLENTLLAPDDPQSASYLVNTTPAPLPEAAGDDETFTRVIQEDLSRLHHQPREPADDESGQEGLRRAIAFSEVEAQRYKRETMEYEDQLKRVMAHSMIEQRQRGSDGVRQSTLNHDDENGDFMRARGGHKNMTEKAAVGSSTSSDARRGPSHDDGHLVGTTQKEFEAQLDKHQLEKSAEEKAEEDVVMEYVRKQSLLEAHHQSKSKYGATEKEY
ncbi:hypothetical protein N0V95_006929 [Ascochyta clinopodiicola]|nr:hypothetical protein N0V95_006929 [Ascochyta clinopodiicola]